MQQELTFLMNSIFSPVRKSILATLCSPIPRGINAAVTAPLVSASTADRYLTDGRLQGVRVTNLYHNDRWFGRLKMFVAPDDHRIVGMKVAGHHDWESSSLSLSEVMPSMMQEPHFQKRIAEFAGMLGLDNLLEYILEQGLEPVRWLGVTSVRRPMSSFALDSVARDILERKYLDEFPLQIRSGKDVETAMRLASKTPFYFWNTCCKLQGTYVMQQLVDSHQDRRENGLKFDKLLKDVIADSYGEEVSKRFVFDLPGGNISDVWSYKASYLMPSVVFREYMCFVRKFIEYLMRWQA